jgi:DNA (cytosine-5)-methyltransferase 1
MKYLSVCSGMEAASVAWHPLGWTPVGFSEIEPFPCAILKHRFPNTPNYGSLTEYQSWPLEPGAIDLLVGGTPCQSFSVAGLRKGLADPRGNLTLTYLGLVDKLKPRWVVYENVPGLLSSNGGRDFGAFLGALGQLGYGFAYRVLDAQHFGVPQRRRRVFVVACLGDWRAAAEVLSLREGLRGYLETGNKKRKGPAADAGASVEAGGLIGGIDYEHNAHGPNDVTGPLLKGSPTGGGHPLPAIAFRKSKRACSTTDNETWVPADASNTLNNFDLGDTRTTHAVVEPIAFHATQDPISSTKVTPCISGGNKQGCASVGVAQHMMPGSVAPTIGASGPPYSRTGNERVEAEALAVTFQPGNLRREAGADPSFTTTTTLKASAGDQTPHVAYPVVPLDGMNLLSRLGECGENHSMQNFEHGDPSFTLRKGGVQHGVLTPMAVRRLTPVECERLQGFPDNWSRISWKGKPEQDCPDGPRYKAAGNSMAVPVMRWIGERIAAVDATLSTHA